MSCKKNIISDKEAAKILIVEDDTTLARVVSLILQNEGFDVRLATSGAEGLKLFNKMSFDLVITDIYVPIMGGFELIHEIQKIDTDPRIIVMSGYDDVWDEENNQVTKCIYGCLDKPFKVTELIYFVNYALGCRNI